MWIIMKNNKLIIGVCDDEKIFRDILKWFIYNFCILQKIEYIQKEYGKAEEVLEDEELPNILFLDIEMSGMTGIELKNHLESRKKVCIVFVTGYADYIMVS